MVSRLDPAAELLSTGYLLDKSPKSPDFLASPHKSREVQKSSTSLLALETCSFHTKRTWRDLCDLGGLKMRACPAGGRGALLPCVW